MKRYIFHTVPSGGNWQDYGITRFRKTRIAMTVAIDQRANELIEVLPDGATWQDLLCALELRGDFEAGLADAKAGRVTEVEELRSVLPNDHSEKGFGRYWSASGVDR